MADTLSWLALLMAMVSLALNVAVLVLQTRTDPARATDEEAPPGQPSPPDTLANLV